MSYGNQLLLSIIQNGDKSALDKVKVDSLLPTSEDGKSEVGLYTLIQKHKIQYGKLPDLTTVKSWGYRIYDTPEPVSFYFELVRKRDVRNALRKYFSEKILPEVKSQDFNVDQITQWVYELNQYVQETETSESVKSLYDLAKEIELEVEQSKLGPIYNAIPFDWPSLDKATFGGMIGGDVVYFVGRPGKGKSSILVAQAYRTWKRGYTPLVVSMEMSDKSFAKRLLSIEGQFNPKALRTYEVTSDTEKRIKQAIKSLEEAPQFYLMDGGLNVTVDKIRANAEKLKPDILYIDAAYLVSNRKYSGTKSFEKLEEVSQDLKALAMELNIPIFQTVQFNREAEKKNSYSLDNLGGTDNYGKLGSIVCSIKPADSPHEKDRREISVIKVREGESCPTFEINFKFDPPNYDEIDENNARDSDDTGFFDDTFSKL